MKQDKETRNKLLQSARAEFLEKGYMKASLRNICRNAGVTTGALYFFFEDKADLFEAITKETINGIYQIMQEHYRSEIDWAESGVEKEQIQDEHAADEAAYKQIIHHMYVHREEILLVLTKSQGSSMEGLLDKFIETSEEHYRVMAKQMMLLYPGKIIDDRFVHWLSHMQIDAFVYMITHIEKEEDAFQFISQAVTYMITGWYGLFQEPKRD